MQNITDEPKKQDFSCKDNVEGTSTEDTFVLECCADPIFCEVGAQVTING